MIVANHRVLMLLPIWIERIRIGPDVRIVVDLPDWDLDVDSGRKLVVSDLGVVRYFSGDHEDHWWIHAQSFADDLI